MAADFNMLVNRYLFQIEEIGVEQFKADILKPLYDMELVGEVTSTSTMDESTTVRRSTFSVEERISAAQTAIQMYQRGQNGGPRSSSVDLGCGYRNF